MISKDLQGTIQEKFPAMRYNETEGRQTKLRHWVAKWLLRSRAARPEVPR
jgi:hypothetical protein